MNLLPFVGEDVYVQLYRRHRRREYRGRLTMLSSNYICLEVGGCRKWISRPRFFKDVVKMISEIDLYLGRYNGVIK